MNLSDSLNDILSSIPQSKKREIMKLFEIRDPLKMLEHLSEKVINPAIDTLKKEKKNERRSGSSRNPG